MTSQAPNFENKHRVLSLVRRVPRIRALVGRILLTFEHKALNRVVVSSIRMKLHISKKCNYHPRALKDHNPAFQGHPTLCWGSLIALVVIQRTEV